MADIVYALITKEGRKEQKQLVSRSMYTCLAGKEAQCCGRKHLNCPSELDGGVIEYEWWQKNLTCFKSPSYTRKFHQHSIWQWTRVQTGSFSHISSSSSSLLLISRTTIEIESDEKHSYKRARQNWGCGFSEPINSKLVESDILLYLPFLRLKCY